MRWTSWRTNVCGTDSSSGSDLPPELAKRGTAPLGHVRRVAADVEACGGAQLHCVRMGKGSHSSMSKRGSSYVEEQAVSAYPAVRVSPPLRAWVLLARARSVRLETTVRTAEARNAGMGFCASIVSDTCSNSIRVLKAYKQTSTVPISYQAAAKTIIAKEGLLGLFGRGLGTRFLANGLNGMLFSVMWKKFQKDLGL